MLAHLKILNGVDRFCFAITSAQMTFLEFSAKETVKDGSHNKVLQTVAFSSTATISQTVTVVCYYLLLLVKALPQVQQPANSRAHQSLFHLMCSTLYGY